MPTSAKSRVWNGNWQATNRGDTQQLQAITDQFSSAADLVRQAASDSRQGGRQPEGRRAGPCVALHLVHPPVDERNVEVNGKGYPVNGYSGWITNYFTHELEPNQAGWDWVSLQLDDSTELMLFRFRHKDGTLDPFSSGTYIDAEGKPRFLSASDFSMAPHGESFTSPATKAPIPYSGTSRCHRSTLMSSAHAAT